MTEQIENLLPKYKKLLFGLIGVGAICVLIGIMMNMDHPGKFWANFLLNNVYFISLAICGTVFIAIHSVALSGWHVVFTKLPDALSSWLPYGAILMILMFFGMSDLYHWTHPDPSDTVLMGKTPYLNVPFFFIRMVVIFGLWWFFTLKLRNISQRASDTLDPELYRLKRKISAGFLIIFSITSSVASWDWIMSIDAHWYSTLFGWYYFSGVFVGGIAAITLLTILLYNLNLLPDLNENHLHDLGKYLFAFSIFWTYLWFSQFLLIWYTNIPEETVYFAQRLDHFPVLFWLNLFLNFVIPFFMLMTRDAKRRTKTLLIVSVVILVGRWIDLYLLIMPGAVHDHASIGLLEMGMTMFYLGAFIYVVLGYLAKKKAKVEKHIFLEESVHYST